MQEMEAHYNAIKGILFCYLYCSASLNIPCTEGHCTATEPHGRKYRKSVPKWDANDGRPPDTVDALAAVDKGQQRKSKARKSSQKRTSELEATSLQLAITPQLPTAATAHC
jgi:hypothetical protein